MTANRPNELSVMMWEYGGRVRGRGRRSAYYLARPKSPLATEVAEALLAHARDPEVRRRARNKRKRKRQREKGR